MQISCSGQIFGTLDELSMSWVLSEKQWPQQLELVPKQVVQMFVKGIGINNKS